MNQITVTIEQVLATPAIHNSDKGWTLYQPVDSYQDEHGTVVAKLIEYTDGELDTSVYYSRAWAYWNFQDAFGDDFDLANQAMQAEADLAPIDYEIGIKAEAVEQINNDSCGHDDSEQDYIDCPNCGAGRIYALECDSCGWSEGQPLRDWSYRRRNPEGGVQ